MKPSLKQLAFWAICCDLGLVAKRLIAPGANLITDALHIPGGIGTGFSLMFIAIAAEVLPGAWACTLMSAVQSALRLIAGHTGSMGALSPVGYLVPGLMMDGLFRLTRRLTRRGRMALSNGAASVGAALTANAIVFRLRGAPLLLYGCVAATAGALFGLLGALIAGKVIRALRLGDEGK